MKRMNVWMNRIWKEWMFEWIEYVKEWMCERYIIWKGWMCEWYMIWKGWRCERYISIDYLLKDNKWIVYKYTEETEDFSKFSFSIWTGQYNLSIGWLDKDILFIIFYLLFIIDFILIVKVEEKHAPSLHS